MTIKGIRTTGRTVAAATLIAVLIILAAAAYLLRVRGDMSDFGVVYKAGERALHGESLYRPADGHLQYKYAPLAAWLYAPFALLPWEAAKAVWFIVILILLAAVLFSARAFLPEPRKTRAFVLGLSFLFLAKFIGREIELGQVNLAVLFLLLLAARSEAAGRPAAAGTAWALSLFFKPYALIFLPWFLVRKSWKTMAVGAAGFAAGLFLPILRLGPAGNAVMLKEWVSTMSRSTPGLLAAGDNASLYAFLSKWPLPPAAALAGGAAIVLALGAVFIWIFVRGRKDGIVRPEALEAAFLITAIPLLSPLGWNYNYLYALPAVVLLINGANRFPLAGRIVLFLNLSVMGGILYETVGAKAFHFYTFYALVAVNGLVILILLARARRTRLA